MPAAYTPLPSAVSATTSNGCVPDRTGPCHVHASEAPVVGLTAPMALLGLPLSVLNAPPSTTLLEPSAVVVMASTGPSTTGAHAELNAPVVGLTDVTYDRGAVNVPPT